MPEIDPLHATRPATLLVADDEAMARNLLRRILEPAGYTLRRQPRLQKRAEVEARLAEGRST